jgi:predicted acyltransferase
MLRVGIMGLIAALLLSSWAGGWVQTMHTNFPIPCVDRLGFLGNIVSPILKTVNSFFTLLTTQFLYVCIPGTIIGDLILNWIEAPEDEASDKQVWSNRRYTAIAVILFLTSVLTLILLKGRFTWVLVICLVPIFVALHLILKDPVKSIERLIGSITKWGMYLLALGLIFEPYQGGIKKDPPTHSYYFVSTGLAVLILVVLTILIDVFKKKKWLQLLIDNGQNPMIAYVAGGNLVGTTALLIGLDALGAKYLTAPWLYFFAYSVVMTLLTALFVSFCTRRNWFWRT